MMCVFLGALGVRCMAPIPNYARMQTLRKMVTTENLEQISAFPFWHPLITDKFTFCYFLGVLKLIVSLQLPFFLTCALLGRFFLSSENDFSIVLYTCQYDITVQVLSLGIHA